ncbi:hypothetical protein M413DRAFT_9292 [Hebeloma cylindrosporum]|uniref:Uncharacterized protein n=1 Tax=Hebeloma cylindrosporum TaxID=76867 RepID=A0A0C3CJU8_HEBCY|nr:hypothetical protein M413DRAFT_9292 [Hebeloma cylindrosporum h7]
MQSLRDEITSSPPPEFPTGSPSREDNVDSGSPQPSPSLPRSSPTPSQPTTHSRKRGSEDLSQFVRNIGRQMKLRKVDQETLEKVASYSPAEQRAWTAAKILKMAEHQEAQVAPEIVFELPKSMKKKMEIKTFSMILDYTMASYIDPETHDNHRGPAAALVKFIRETPSWGFTPSMAQDSKKLSVLVTDTRLMFTKRRASIKMLIKESFGTDKNQIQNIVELSQSILNLSKSGKVKLTIHHCVRFAFIRKIAAGNYAGKDFWKTVDRELEATRQMPERKQSKFLASILAADRKLYGDSPDLSALGTPSIAPARQKSPTPAEDEEDIEDEE